MLSAEELKSLVDSYLAAKEARLAMGRQLAKLEEIEKDLKSKLLTALLEQKLTAIGGSTHSATLSRKDKPTVTNWAEVYIFIKATDSFDLLQRRLTDSAVTARWEDGVEIPGIGKFPVYDLSFNKL